MKNVYDAAVAKEIVERIENLRPDTQRLWGKMNVAQMLAHCSVGLEVILGRHNPPRIFIGRLLSPFIKKAYYDEKPFHQNSPTAKSFVIADERDFETEKNKLIALVKEVSEGSAAKCTTHPHAFFGELTPIQWSIGMFKHLDHHLRQFGV